MWHKDAVIYQVRVRSFADGNGDGVGDFVGLRSRIPYLKGLGVDCLWLLPIHPSPLADDGYDVADYYSVHPDYGSLEDFRAFLEEAHSAGLRVILDLVLNHTSDKNPWFVESRFSRDSPKRDWYVWSDSDKRYAGVPVIFRDLEKSNWAWDPGSKAFYWHRFFSSQPDLNFDNPEVRRRMLEVADHWLAMGVDGFRLDAIPFLFEREGTSCKHLPETHAYLKELRRFVDERHPGRVLIAEAVGAPEEILPYFSECHMAFDFPLASSLFLALADGQAAPLVDVLRRSPKAPESCSWGLFLRNHDEVSLSFLDEAGRRRMLAAYAPEGRMRLHGNIRRRLGPMLGGDPARLRLVHALLFALPGTPVLYYGDEIGMGEDLSLPDRFGLRTPMEWEKAERLREESGSLVHWIAEALKTRSGNPVFTRGSFKLLDGPESCLAFEREHEGQKLAAVFNLSGRPSRGLPAYGFDWRLSCASY